MTKEELCQYIAIKKEIDQIKQELERVEATMTSPRIQQLTGMPRGGSSGDSMVNIIARCGELREKYSERMLALMSTQLEIEQAIDTLDPTARRLMRYRYIDGLAWEEICVKIGYSWRQTHRLHSEALRELRGE